MNSYYRKLLVTTIIVLLLPACAIVPKVSEHQNYASTCKMLTRKLTLDIKELDIEDCSENTFGKCLVVYGIISPILTFVASGSVVVIGNTVHWLEYEGRCENSDLQKQIAKIKST